MKPMGLKALIQAKKQGNLSGNSVDTFNNNCDNTARKMETCMDTFVETKGNVIPLPIKKKKIDSDNIGLKLKYNALLAREKKGEEYIDNPCRTEEEISRCMPVFNQILTDLNHIIDTIGLNNCTADERTNGFNIIPLIGDEVSLKELPAEWQ